jgi:Concanavalin A-like lectin/glucanases superfamily
MMKARRAPIYHRSVRSRCISVLTWLTLALAGCVPDDWHYAGTRDAEASDTATPDAADDVAADVEPAPDASMTSSCEPPREVPCASGLVDLYRGDGNARDCVGVRHASANRWVTYGPGRYGSAFNLDGSPALVSIPSAVADLEKEFSISLWVKGSRPARVLARRAVCWGVPAFRGFDIGIDRDGTANCEVFPSGTATFFVLTSPTNVVDDQWHHLALVRRGATIALYVDGQTTGPHRFDGDFVDPYSTPAYLGVSRCVVGAPGGNGTFDDRQWFHGALDEVGFYNRALTNQELDDLAAGRCAP